MLCLYLLFGMLAPRAASAVQSAELYRSQAQFYGRFEALQVETAHPWHADVQEDHVGPPGADCREAIPSVMADHRLVARILEGAGKEGGNLLVILDHDDSDDWSSRSVPPHIMPRLGFTFQNDRGPSQVP